MSLLVWSSIQILVVVVLHLNCTVLSHCQNINSTVYLHHNNFLYITLGLTSEIDNALNANCYNVHMHVISDK